jgi:hypothetical protein
MKPRRLTAARLAAKLKIDPAVIECECKTHGLDLQRIEPEKYIAILIKNEKK